MLIKPFDGFRCRSGALLPRERPLPLPANTGKRAYTTHGHRQRISIRQAPTQAATEGFTPTLCHYPAPQFLRPQPLNKGSAEHTEDVPLRAPGCSYLVAFQRDRLSRAISNMNRSKGVMHQADALPLRALHPGNRFCQSSKQMLGVTNLEDATPAHRRCLTARLLTCTVHLRTATLPLRVTLQPLLANVHRPYIAGSGP